MEMNGDGLRSQWMVVGRRRVRGDAEKTSRSEGASRLAKVAKLGPCRADSEEWNI